MAFYYLKEIFTEEAMCLKDRLGNVDIIRKYTAFRPSLNLDRFDDQEISSKRMKVILQRRGCRSKLRWIEGVRTGA